MPKRALTVEDLYHSYLVSTKITDMSAIQDQEMRRAFFGGALASFSLVLGLTDLDDDAIVYEEINKVAEELKLFTELVTKGEA